MTKIEIGQISGIGRSLFIICLLAGAIITATTHYPAGIIAGAALGIYLMFAIKVVQQWEKVAVLRLGRYVGLRGPGIFHIVPIVETLSPYVDQRVRVANVSAESTLTRDTVPVNVDAIVFWLVWNAEKSILEVMDFDQAITLSAQTALRESIGRHDLAILKAVVQVRPGRTYPGSGGSPDGSGGRRRGRRRGRARRGSGQPGRHDGGVSRVDGVGRCGHRAPRVSEKGRSVFTLTSP